MDSRTKALVSQSQAHQRAGRISRAFQTATLALESARQSGDPAGQCSALAQLAHIHMRLGHYAQARKAATQALATQVQTASAALALRVLGNCASYSNQLDQAETLLHRAVDLSRQIGDERGRALGLHSLAAMVYSLRGQFELALSASTESFHINQKIGVPDWGSPMIRAEIFRLIGERHQARAALQELGRTAQPGSTQQGVYLCYQARLALDEDDLDEAGRWLQACRSVAEAVGSPVLDVWLRVETSRWARLQGDVPAARAWAEDGVASSERAGFGYLSVLAHVEQAQVLWAGGDPAAAQALLQGVLPVAKQCDLRYEQARIAFFLAGLAQQQESESAATLWLEAVDRLAQGGWAFLLERERTIAFPLLDAHLSSPHPRARAAARSLMEPLARIAPLPLHISGLGRFQVRRGRQPIPDRRWQRRKAGELFRYLLLQAGHKKHRDVLIEALWPGLSPKSGQAAFHQATSSVRRILEPDLPGKFPSRYLAVEGEQVSLHLPSGSTIDYVAFEEQAIQALRDNSYEPLAQAVALYGDDLFPGDRYADWAAATRERLSQLYLRVLSALAEQHLQRGSVQKCLDCCAQLLARDAWHEEGTLLAMRARLELNDRPGALLLYERLEQTLREELGLAPRADLQALADSLRQA